MSLSLSSTARLVDHEHRLSFAVILGSFRSQGGTELDQHYVSLSYLHNTDTSTGGANDLDEDLRGGNNRDEGALSSTSSPMKRFLEWARGRWLTMFSGFGAKGSNESWWGSRGDLGNNARAESSFEEPSSSKRKIGINVDVDVHCISGGGMGPVDEVGENKAAPDREDMVSDDDSG